MKLVAIDPTAPVVTTVGVSMGDEMTVEDIARLQAYEAAHVSGRVASVPVPSRQAQAGAQQDIDALEGMQPGLPSGITKRLVSGRYRGSNGSSQLELRVDVDGKNPTRMISGDFYRVAGSTVTYTGSFLCRGVTVVPTEAAVTIIGTGEFTFTTGFPKVRVTIPRSLSIAAPAAAIVEFLSVSDAAGSSYGCDFESPYFRTVQIEQDRMANVTSFVSYNTGALQSGGQARDLSIINAYAEAGVEMLDIGNVDVVPEPGGGVAGSGTWSDAELHASMLAHFSQWKDQPQWKVWLFHAFRHDKPNLLGIMFDQQGAQRQGAAVFYKLMSGPEPANHRYQLYSCVHELGHCFNMYHSWVKNQMYPPEPNRPRALSFMNYPQQYPDNTAAFWRSFSFGFDAEELMHIRHSFRNAIIMGGNDFGVSAALENADLYKNPVRDDSGLGLELEAPLSFRFGEPVSLTVRLGITDMRGKQVHGNLSPGAGYVHYAIQRPDGRVMRYESLLTHCSADDMIALSFDQPFIREEVFLGYGLGGHYFDTPGFYKVRALYYAVDGSEVLSNIATLRVRAPTNQADEESADLLFGDEQGTLIYMLGSDAAELQQGNDALNELIDRHGEHQLALYAQAAKMNNVAREFKIVGGDDKMHVRPSGHEQQSSDLENLEVAVDGEAATPTSSLSSMLQLMARRKMARARGVLDQEEAGLEAAVVTNLPPQVVNYLSSRTDLVARELASPQE